VPRPDYTHPIRRIREAADELNRMIEADPLFPAAPVEPAATLCLAASVARRLYALRRMRERWLEVRLFADPAWDILLDLYVAGAEGRHISMSSACIAAAVPATTAQRWIRALERAGLVERHPDPRDQRRVYVSLTDHAQARLTSMLHEMGVVLGQP
jgi:DNA-binding MarR family transcriptional regulator